MRTFALLVLAAAVSPSAAAAQVIYVKASATGANDGTSWTDAFTRLNSALQAAGPQHSIWVAAGTYRPSEQGNRDVSFLIRTNQIIHGGFAGTETSFEQRAGFFDATILTGDLAGDDGPGFTNMSDNSRHVVELQFGSIGIDGFTVTGGNARDGQGGGLFAFMVSNFRIENCIFRANHADHGGGAVSMSWHDGAIVRRCLFVGNRSDRGGGALEVSTVDDPARVESCRFVGNVAAFGGAVSAYAVEFVGCEFSGNSARSGGAFSGSSSSFQNCTIAGNVASGHGVAGGIQGNVQLLRSSVVWGNRNADGEGEGAQLMLTGSTTVQGSCVQGWTGDLDDGTGNLFGDPRFVDLDGPDDVAGTIDDDLRLGPNSSCLDTGILPVGGIVLPARDLGGAVRFVDNLACDAGGVLDVGARERQIVDGSTSYCAQPPTSLGVPAEIDAPCVVGVAGGVLHLRVGPVPSSTAIIFYGSEIVSTPFGGDTFCVGGSVHRAPEPTATGSHLGLSLDLADPRAAAFVPGSTWHFQALFRDGGSLRLSDATTITFRE